MPRRFIATTLLMVLAPQGWALDCKTAIVQSDLNECAGRDYAAADARLNTVYDQLVARLAHATAPDARTLLVAAQRAWIKFRDADCALQTATSEGGSAHPMEELGCLTTATEKRIAVLKAYLSCKAEDGDCLTATGD